MKKLILLCSFVFIWYGGLNVSANSGQETPEEAEVITLNGSKSVKVESELVEKDEEDEEAEDDLTDFYQLNVTKTGKVTIKIDSMPFDDSSSVDIAITDGDQAVYADFDSLDDEVGGDSIHAYLKKGTYFMQVNFGDMFSGDKYELTLALDSDGLYEGENNNSKNSANPIELNNIYQASLMAEDLADEFIEHDDEDFDRDFYRFEVKEDGRIQLDSATTPGEPLVWSLWNTSGQKIWSKIQTKKQENEAMTPQFVEYLKKGTYILSVQYQNASLMYSALEYELPYKFKISHLPIMYSEISGSNYSFGKVYEGSLLKEEDSTDSDAFKLTTKEKLYITTNIKAKSAIKTKINVEVLKQKSIFTLTPTNQWMVSTHKNVVGANQDYTIQLSKTFGEVNPMISYNVSSIAHPYWGKFYYAPNMLGKMKTKLAKTQLYREKGGKIIKSGTPVNKNNEYKVIRKGKTFFTLSDGRLVKVKDVTFTAVPNEVKKKYRLLNQLK